MTGTSYNGTLPLAAATTGVEGLEAIIPDRAEHVVLPLLPLERPRAAPGRLAGRGHRLPLRLHQQRRPGAARVLQRARIATASSRERPRSRAPATTTTSGPGAICCTKVEQHQGRGADGARLQRLERGARAQRAHLRGAQGHACRCRPYFHQGGHGGAPPLELMNKWFTRYLYGVENGVEKDPKAWIVREAAPAAPPTAERRRTRGWPRTRRGATPPPTPYADYPNPDAAPVTLHLRPGGARTAAGARRAPQDAARDARRQRRVRRRRRWRSAESSPTPAALRDARADRAGAHLRARRASRSASRRASRRRTSRCGSWRCRGPTARSAPANLITRGWADPQNHASLTKGGDFTRASAASRSCRASSTTLTFDLQPDDQIIPAGKRIGLMIFSSDRDFTLWPQAGHRADDRPRPDVAAAAGRRRPGRVQPSRRASSRPTRRPVTRRAAEPARVKR